MVNKNVLSKIKRNDLSNTEGMKVILSKLTKEFHDIYGKDPIYRGMSELKEDGDFVYAPGLVRARETGKVRLALLVLDVSSSGEHWDTVFLTENALFFQSSKKRDFICEAILDEFVPYDYCYSIDIEDDIHIDNDDIHPDMKNILDAVK